MDSREENKEMEAVKRTGGLVHIYCGNGKGKTTASVGAAVRAAGNGKTVLIKRFLKNDHSRLFPALFRNIPLPLLFLPVSFSMKIQTVLCMEELLSPESALKLPLPRNDHFSGILSESGYLISLSRTPSFAYLKTGISGIIFRYSQRDILRCM